jgi:thioredoxin reductase (NADPH)
MKNDQSDVIILGTGPAGLQAAIHAARKKVSVLVLGRPYKSSLYRAHIENYCCLSGVNGETLISEGKKQAEKSGAAFLNEDVIGMSREEPWFIVKSESGKHWRSRAIIFAMGISRNMLNIPGEKELQGHGVSYCIDCDANFFRDTPVAVVGCESAAVSGALTLMFYTDRVHLVCEKLEVTDTLTQRIRESTVHLHEGSSAKEILGEKEVAGLVLDDGTRLDVKGVFIELGAKGAVGLAAEIGVVLDTESMKYIGTNKKQETNVPGVYAAGDICGPPWQVAKAVGEGCVAGLEAASYAKMFK